jgi:hypothetical protein
MPHNGTIVVFFYLLFHPLASDETIPPADETIFPGRRNIEATGAC